MDNIEEQPVKLKRLIPIKMMYSLDDNVYSFIPQEQGYSSYNFKATQDMLHRLFSKLNVKDSLITPNKKRMVPYKTIIEDLTSKGQATIYIWKSYFPTSLQHIQTLMQTER